MTITRYTATYFPCDRLQSNSTMFNSMRPLVIKCARGAIAAAGVASMTLVTPHVFTTRLDSQLPHSHERPTYTPCPEVSCKSKEELAAMFTGSGPLRRVRRLPTDTATGAMASAAGETGAGQTAALPIAAPNAHMPGCPLDREELGRASWAVLHTIAAYYPDSPTEEDMAAAEGLVKALRLLYPCKHCRAQLEVDLQRIPPRLNNRVEFSLWMCEQHNAVSELLGKPTQPCKIEDLDARWRTGRPDCWLGAEQTAQESLGQADDEEEDT